MTFVSVNRAFFYARNEKSQKSQSTMDACKKKVLSSRALADAVRDEGLHRAKKISRRAN